MIPHAITNTGSYVDLWSQLKAIQHALKRTLTAEDRIHLTALDREMLARLADLLRNALPSPDDSKPSLESYFESLSSYEAESSLDFDLGHALRGISEFEQWLPAHKLGFEKKVQRLLSTIDRIVQESDQGLLVDRPPEDEFRVLQAIVAGLLVQVESALNT